MNLTDPPRKNDALLLYGAAQPLPFVVAYEQPCVEVVQGPSCRPAREVHLERCRAEGVRVCARRGGGGVVVLAPGMVVTVVVGRRPPGEVRRVYRLVQDALVGVLAPFGPRLEQEGISDLALGGRKVAGSSLYMPRQSGMFFYQSSLLVSCDLALLDRYLAHPPREPAYRAGRRHGEFCTTLVAAGFTLTPAETARLIRQDLAAAISRVPVG